MDPSIFGFLSSFEADTVTPSDSADLTNIASGIYVGTTGNLTVTMANKSSKVTFKNVIQGQILRIRVSRVWAAGTTATDLIALY